MEKCRVMVVVLVFLSAADAHAETGIALKAGPNAATLAEDNRFNRYGVSGGVAGYLQRPLIDRYSLAGQVELLYAPRGAEAFLEGEYLGRFREHYLDVALAARPSLRFGRASPYLLLGGSLNFLLSANREDARGEKDDTTEALSRVDVALLVGVGIALHLPGRALGPLRLGTAFLEGRHDHGLIDTSPFGGYKNRNTSVMLGFSFTLGVGAVDAQPGAPPVRIAPPPPIAAIARPR